MDSVSRVEIEKGPPCRILKVGANQCRKYLHEIQSIMTSNQKRGR